MPQMKPMKWLSIFFSSNMYLMMMMMMMVAAILYHTIPIIQEFWESIFPNGLMW